MPCPVGVVGDELAHIGWPGDGEVDGLIIARHGECGGTVDHQEHVVGVIVECNGVAVGF